MLTDEKAEKYLAILFTLMVCTTRLSMAAGQIFMALGTILTLYMLWLNRKTLLRNNSANTIIKAYGIMLLCFLPSVFGSLNIAASAKVFMGAWVYRFFVFIGIAYFINSRKLLTNMLGTFLLVTCFDCLVALYQILTKMAPRGWGYGSNTLTLAGLLTMLFPIVIVTILDEHFDEALKKISSFSLVAILIGFFANKSRGAWLVALLTAPLTLWQYIWRSKKLMISCVLILTCIVSVFAFHPTYNKRLKSITNITTDRSNGDRIVVWKVSKDLVLQNPVLGLGPGEFHDYYRYKLWDKKEDTQGLAHTHNNFIQVAVEEGLMGLVGLLYFLGVVMWQSLKEYFKDHNPFDLLIFTTLLVYVVLFGQIEYGLDNSSNMRIMWFLHAILIKMKLANNEKVR